VWRPALLKRWGCGNRRKHGRGGTRNFDTWAVGRGTTERRRGGDRTRGGRGRAGTGNGGERGGTRRRGPGRARAVAARADETRGAGTDETERVIRRAVTVGGVSQKKKKKLTRGLGLTGRRNWTGRRGLAVRRCAGGGSGRKRHGRRVTDGV